MRPSLALTLIAAMATSSCLGAVVLPKATNLEVRLLTQLGSRSSKPGDKLEAAIIAPVAVGNSVVSLQGSTLLGTVVESHAVGFGFKRAAADLGVRFDAIRSPDGRRSPVLGQISEVENAREHVEPGGHIHGIDPAANLSAGFSFLMSTVLIHTELEVPTLIVKLLTARSPNSEISLPAGTEMFVRLQQDAILDASSVNRTSPEAISPEDLLRVDQALDKLPSQRVQFTSRRLSDLLNFALIGTESQIRNAFIAAGWAGESKHSPLALYGLFHGLTQRQGFPMAPMSVLSLNGQPATITFQKSLNTISKRHHIRLWQQAGSDLWFAAATEDTGIRFSRMRLTHSTATQIDNERAKVFNDLWYAGCIEGASLMGRDHLLPSLANAHTISTDGNLAVLRMGTCSGGVPYPRPPHTAQARLALASSAVVSDVMRSNPITVGLLMGHTAKVLLGRSEADKVAANPEPIERVSLMNKESDSPAKEQVVLYRSARCNGVTGQ